MDIQHWWDGRRRDPNRVVGADAESGLSTDWCNPVVLPAIIARDGRGRTRRLVSSWRSTLLLRCARTVHATLALGLNLARPRGER